MLGCAVPENISTPPQKQYRSPEGGGGGDSVRQKMNKRNKVFHYGGERCVRFYKVVTG